MATPKYGDLIRLGPDDGEVSEVLKRVPLGAVASQGSVSEGDLQKLLFRFPETLPIATIDATYAGAVPICQELHTPAGFVDALYVNPFGRITLTEFKLWRNPFWATPSSPQRSWTGCSTTAMCSTSVARASGSGRNGKPGCSLRITCWEATPAKATTTIPTDKVAGQSATDEVVGQYLGGSISDRRS